MKSVDKVAVIPLSVNALGRLQSIKRHGSLNCPLGNSCKRSPVNNVVMSCSLLWSASVPILNDIVSYRSKTKLLTFDR